MFSRILKTLTATVLIALLMSPAALQPASAQFAAKRPVTNAKRAEKRILQIKFTESSGVTLVDGKFVSPNTEQTDAINNLLNGAKKIKAGSRAANKQADPVRHALRNHYKVRFGHDVNTTAIAEQLQKFSIVERAYAQQKPVAPPTADYRGLQTYLKAAPTGINQAFAVSYPGGMGNRVKIVDIEYDWNLQHEDLDKAQAAFVPNGTPANPFDSNNHGTAVLGELIATNDAMGVTGGAHGSTIEVINAYNLERGWDVAGALTLAGSRTKPGDVILLEQQADGPSFVDGDYVPIEWLPDVYDAVLALTQSGRIVIEAGGNGNQNLNDTTLFGDSFPVGKIDSGAIIVGAGEHCDAASARSRLYFSNYGNRIDVQGPGNCVTTTGYGGLAGTVPNNLYTNTFAGTSSASPVVAASAALFSSTYQTLNGRVPSPLELRMLMIATGTAQNMAGLAGKIGSYPNLAKFLPTADMAAPGAPGSFALTLSTNKPNLKWATPADNVKVASYQIYRDGKLYKTVTTTTFRDAAAVKGRKYTYKVRALDVRPNYSAFTAQKTVISK